MIIELTPKEVARLKAALSVYSAMMYKHGSVEADQEAWALNSRLNEESKPKPYFWLGEDA